MKAPLLLPLKVGDVLMQVVRVLDTPGDEETMLLEEGGADCLTTLEDCEAVLQTQGVGVTLMLEMSVLLRGDEADT